MSWGVSKAFSSFLIQEWRCCGDLWQVWYGCQTCRSRSQRRRACACEQIPSRSIKKYLHGGGHLQQQNDFDAESCWQHKSSQPEGDECSYWMIVDEVLEFFEGLTPTFADGLLQAGQNGVGVRSSILSGRRTAARSHANSMELPSQRTSSDRFGDLFELFKGVTSMLAGEIIRTGQDGVSVRSGILSSRRMAVWRQTGSTKVSGEIAMTVANAWIVGRFLELCIARVRQKDSNARRSHA